MSPQTPTSQLANAIKELQTERQSHLDAIAEIDATFEQYGIDPAAVTSRGPGRPRKASTRRKKRTTKKRRAGATAKRGPGRPRKKGRPGRPSKKRTAGRPRRGGSKQTAADFILSLLSGGKKLTTAQIKEAWEADGRKGPPHPTLSMLAKRKKLKRENVPGSRGSQFVAT